MSGVWAVLPVKELDGAKQRLAGLLSPPQRRALAEVMLGEVLESKAGTVTSTELTLAMPECDALGDILVLKNPGQDVTLAAVN